MGEEAEKSMREDFEAAIETVGEEEQPEDVNHGEIAEDTSAAEQEPAAEAAPETEAEPSGIKSEEPPAEETDNSAGESGSEAGKAPAGWTPAERELWADLPDSVRSRVNKREKEISDGLNDQVENRKLGQQYADMASKYQATFAAEGFANNPAQAIEGLVEVVTNMRFGTPEQKAQRIAGFIKTYGVDIGMLDDMLAGAAPSPEQAQSNQMEQMLDQRMAPVNTLLAQLEQNNANRVNATNAKAGADVNTFGETAEFISDVRLDMADLMDMAAKRGQDMTLQQAYDKACALNPEISGVLSKRAEDDRIMGNNQDVQGKLAAASSIHGDKSGSGGGSGDMSLRQMIEQGFG